jgi:hypothetical protein
MENQVNRNITFEEFQELKRRMDNMELSKIEFANRQTAFESRQNKFANRQNELANRQTAFDNRQTAFDNRQNIFDFRLNTQDNKILFLSQQVENLRNEMAKLGEQKGREIRNIEDVKNITAEPLPGEEEFLKGLVEGKVPEWGMELKKIKRNCISSMIDMSIDTALSVYKFKNDQDRKASLYDEDKMSFASVFIKSFTETAITDINSAKSMAIEFAAKILIVGAKYCYVSYKKHIADSHLEEFWEDQIKSYVKDIKKYLQDSNDFYRMVDEYIRKYDYNYGRDDVFLNENKNWCNSNAPQYRRKFNNIPEYVENIEEYTDVSEKIHNSSVGDFDRDLYLREKLTEDEVKKFNSKFRMYRAMKKYGEFSDQSHCGDTLANIHIVAGVVATCAFVVPGIIYAVGSGSARAAKKIIWMNNKSRLKEEVLLKCVDYYNEEILEEIIEKRNILSIIENYVEFSGSKFGKKFLEECKKTMYAGIQIEKRKLFDTAFDLYQKMTNTGIADRDNYLKYCFVNKLVTEKDCGTNKLMYSNLKKIADVLQRLEHPGGSIITETNEDGKKKKTITKKVICDDKEITETIVEDYDGTKTSKIEEKTIKSYLNFSSIAENIENALC